MNAFIIFWISFFAGIFFLTSILLRGILAAFEALISTLVQGIGILVKGSIAVFGMVLMYDFVDTIAKKGMGYAVELLFMIVIFLIIVIAIFGGIGSIILEFIILWSTIVTDIILLMLGKLYEVNYNTYIRCMNVIIAQVKKLGESHG